jgi:hypothetical protein
MSLTPIQTECLGFPLIQFLSTNGDGTGTINAVGDYTATPTPFYIQPSATAVYVITELLLQLSDVGAAFALDEYGNLNAPLINGVLIRAKRGSAITLDILGGQPILPARRRGLRLASRERHRAAISLEHEIERVAFNPVGSDFT